MAGNSFGELFRITTWGESHGSVLGAVIDGCPAGLKLSEKDIQPDLDRRKPAQSRITSGRQEDDRVEILSGVFEGVTLGTPIALFIRNKDARGADYAEMKEKYRPSHADYTYQAKYGVRNFLGGGRASARETAARVAAGAIAKKILIHQGGIEILGWVDQLGADLKARVDADKVRSKDIEKNIVRCPNQAIAKKMIEAIEKVRSKGDTIGGKVKCVARNVPAGLGEPVFDKLHADLAKGIVSLPAVRGFEIGSGLDSLQMRGSEHNDPFEMRGGAVRTAKNDSGGVQGGISNGENILVAVTFKPVATIFQKQKTVNTKNEAVEILPRGRHDPCVLPRAVVLVEAMMALVLCDHWLRNKVARMG